MARFTINADPAGEHYRNVVQRLAKFAATFTLVLSRTDVRAGQAAKRISAALEPAKVAECRVTSWPGTELLRGSAQLARYELTDPAMQVLIEAPSLFSWVLPDRPEDLALYDTDGTAVLFTVAHERFAVITTPWTRRVTEERLPDLRPFGDYA